MKSPAGTSPVEHWTFQVDSPFRSPAEIRDLTGRAADEARGAGLGDTWSEAEDPFLTEFEQTDELDGYEEAETEGAEPAEAEAAVAEADLLEETPASEHPLAAVFSLPRLAFNAMAKGGWATAIAVAIGAGLRDVNKLTNMIFWFRHPQMIGQKIRPDQRDLAREWTNIRDGIVKPAFASASAPSAPSSPPTPGPLGADGRTSIPSDGLRWYGPGEAPPELMAFMRKVYDLHVKRSRGDFVDTLPETALEEVEPGSGKKARKDAARKAREMLAAARAALAAEGLTGTVRIGVLSAYRSADLQFDIWQGKTTKGKGGFPHYYQETKSTRQHPKYGGEHSDKAAAYLAEYMALYVAAPGYSNHQDGLALDLGTRKGKGGLIKLYKGSWFHDWMCVNARTYQFEPLASEAWHWTYRPTAGASEAETWEFQSSTPFLSAENWAWEVTPAAIKAGTLEVQKIPLLASHHGRAPDLILRWNEMPTVPAEIDVVVHLHGYSWATMTLPKHMEVWAGLDLAPVDGASGAGRSRPTLTVLPRGHFTGVKVGKIYRYTFPALTTKDGLTTLVRVAMEHFANQVGGPPPKVGRLIMTAHSGGGAPLMQILRRHDPHEVHVFDGLYQDPNALAEWAGRHITADRAAVQAGGAPSGAMRVFFGPSTRLFSTRLHNVIAADLRDAPTSIADRYRVESSRLGHWQIARQYGWRVLADAGADVPDAKRPPPTERSVKRLFEADSAAVPSLPETPFPAEELDSAEADEAEAWELGETATEGRQEVNQLGGSEAEGEPWPAPELEDQEEDEEAPGDLRSLEALGDVAEFGSETESGPGRWGSFAEADMKPSIALKTVESPLYQGNALENAWQQTSPEPSKEQYAGDVRIHRPAAAEDLKGYETSLEAEAVRDFDEAHRSRRDDGLTADTADEHEEGYWSAEEYEPLVEGEDVDYVIRGGRYTPAEKRHAVMDLAGLVMTTSVIGRLERRVTTHAPSPLSVSKKWSRFGAGRLGDFVADYNEFTDYLFEVLAAIGRLQDLLSAGAPELPNLMTSAQKHALRPTTDRPEDYNKKTAYRLWRDEQAKYATAKDGVLRGLVSDVGSASRQFEERRHAFWQAAGDLKRTLEDAKRLGKNKPTYEALSLSFSDALAVVDPYALAAKGIDLVVDAYKKRKEYEAKIREFATRVGQANDDVKNRFEKLRDAQKSYWAALLRHRQAIQGLEKQRLEAREKAALVGQSLAPPGEKRLQVLAEIRMPILVADAWHALAVIGPPARASLDKALKGHDVVIEASGADTSWYPKSLGGPPANPWAEITQIRLAWHRANSWSPVLTSEDIEEWVAVNKEWDETFTRFNV
jgi:hypothetical protein